MRPGQARFVTACQQLLVLGAVLAALTPAAGVVSLEIVGRPPAGARPAPATGDGTTRAPAVRMESARVPLASVEPTVREYALTAPSGTARHQVATVLASRSVAPDGAVRLVSRPAPVTGFGAVGLSWAPGAPGPADASAFSVRTREVGGVWSDWQALPYDPDHGPDPKSDEAEHARPGTDPLLVGDVDEVQVRADVPTAAPADLSLAVVDPGTDGATEEEAPAIDTGAGAGGAVQVQPEATGAEPAIALESAAVTAKPRIFSRAQWGADESMRDRSSLHYYEVHAGFVHHTVNANDYTRAEVPALIRSIYAYHVRVRGWSDIGYNFLVDRFGRIWEGRYGGVDRPVVGAHTLGYNDYSFAMSAIGNFETAQPRDRMLRAYGALFAWKLSLHGVDASSTQQKVGSDWFQAVNGHRDAAATACPGRNLYAQLPLIRTYAAEDQLGWAGRELASNLAGTRHPDLIVRRASDGQAFILPTGGLLRFTRPSTLLDGWSAGDVAVASPDLNRDGRGDVLVRGSNGIARIHPGDGAGGLGSPVLPTKAFAGRDLITAVGDLDGNGANDLVARDPARGTLVAYWGRRDVGFRRTTLATGFGSADVMTGAGDLTGDGHPDLLVRAGGDVRLYPGTGRRELGRPQQLGVDLSRYSVVRGLGDYTGDGADDLLVREAATGDAWILPSRGNGTFDHRLGPFTGQRGLRGLSAAQLAGTAAPDVVGVRNGRLIVLRNAGTVNLRRPIATGLDLSAANLVLNAGDWDGDGHGDIVTRSSRTGALRLRLGDGRGHFGSGIVLGTDFGSVDLIAAVGDMTGDGLPDLMGQPRGKAMRIYPGNGAGPLRPSYVAYSGIDAARQVGVGRWNADGSPDTLVRSGPTLRLYPGNGPGGLTNPVRTLDDTAGSYDWVIGVSDLSLTGHPDVIVRGRTTGFLFMLSGSESGFAPRRLLGEGMEAYDLAG